MDSKQLQHLRGEYSKLSLNETDVQKNPIKQFEIWMDEALKAQIPEPNAMTLATVDSQNKPRTRIMLLKEFDEHGFIFYSNYASSKGKELENNPNASLCFLWLEMERQVRIDGKAEKLPRSISEEYFKQRPYESQIGAMASNQSEVVESREYLESKFDRLKEKFNKGEVPMPETWGGYRLIPEAIEFWQGRQGRLHDRIKYELTDGAWTVKRLSP